VNWWTILAVAVSLAMDAFAVSIAVGLTLPRVTARHVFRLAWHFGLFQFLMPVAGYFSGRAASGLVAAWDHWIAFSLLSLVGAKMLYEAYRGPSGATRRDPTRGLTLLVLSLATSLDALAVGVTMALLDVRIWTAAVVIGLVAGAMTTVGICFARLLGARWEKLAETAGGIILLLIGARILASHLLGW